MPVLWSNQCRNCDAARLATASRSAPASDRLDLAFDVPVERLNRQTGLGLLDQRVEIEPGPLLLGQLGGVTGDHIHVLTGGGTSGHRSHRGPGVAPPPGPGPLPAGPGTATDLPAATNRLLGRRRRTGRCQLIGPDAGLDHRPIQTTLRPTKHGQQPLHPGPIMTGHIQPAHHARHRGNERLDITRFETRHQDQPQANSHRRITSTSERRRRPRGCPDRTILLSR